MFFQNRVLDVYIIYYMAELEVLGLFHTKSLHGFTCLFFRWIRGATHWLRMSAEMCPLTPVCHLICSRQTHGDTFTICLSGSDEQIRLLWRGPYSLVPPLILRHLGTIQPVLSSTYRSKKFSMQRSQLHLPRLPSERLYDRGQWLKSGSIIYFLFP